MSMWYDLLAIMKDVTLGEDEDHIMWCFSSNGKYSVQTLYAVINHRGIVPMFFHAIWKLKIPPRVQIFPWLTNSFFCEQWLTNS